MADTVLLIDDDAVVLKVVGDYLEKSGWEVHREGTAENGLEAFHRLRPAVVIVDLHLPDANGLDVLEQLRAKGAAVILLTGQGDIETAVRAMQLGAENFITKPPDMVHLAAAVARVGEKVRLARQNALLRSGGRSEAHEDSLESLGVSPGMKALAHQVGLLAASDRTTVLLTGESGTGKGWVARIIHNLSPRAKGPFVEVNCGGLSATFLDSELFGHERGAFTDAKERKQGLFELADGGTIFLDEIGELSLELQPKLLKVLETKTFRRLGGTREMTVDVRLIAATNRDLVVSTREGRFREDLFYRLSVMPVHIPAVRERTREDRLALLRRLFGDLAAQMPGCPAAASAESARPAALGAMARKRPGDAQRSGARHDSGAGQAGNRGGTPAGRFAAAPGGAAVSALVARGHRAVAYRAGRCAITAAIGHAPRRSWGSRALH